MLAFKWEGLESYFYFIMTMFVRSAGGGYGNTSNTGVFLFHTDSWTTGEANENAVFRLVIII